MTIGGFELPVPALLLGAVTGMTYGVLAVGLVLVYRSNRVINFAHGEIGALGASVLILLTARAHVPYWAAFALALVASGGVAAAAEATVIRRMRNAPPVMSIVVTLGLGLFLGLSAAALRGQAASIGYNRGVFPQPSGLPSFEVGPLLVTPAYSAMLFVTPCLVAALALFLRRGRTGLAIRAAAANADGARLSSISPGRMASISWAAAGALAAFTAILVMPTRVSTNIQFLGPGLLMRALAAAVIGRMVSLPTALIGGIGVGIVESLLQWNYPSAGLVEAILFVVVLCALLVQRQRGGREEEKGSWAVVQGWRPLPEAFGSSWAIRNLGRCVAVLSLVLAVVLGLIVTNASAVNLSTITALALVGLSMGVITGLGGQLSLGQFGIAGVGAVASYVVVRETGNFVVAFFVAGIASSAVSLAIGLPALRIRGMMLAVTTLAFALAAQSWLLGQQFAFGAGVNPGRPSMGSLSFDTGRRYYFFALGVLAFGFWIARNVWTSGLGRRLRAVRDNEDGARAFTVPAVSVKLQGFVLAGFLAGLGGAVYAHSLALTTSATFPIGMSINVVALSVLGGLGLLAGPVIGALYVIGVPAFVPLDNAGLAASALGWLVLVLYFPGGIAQLVRPLRDRLADVLARMGGIDPAAVRTEVPAGGAGAFEGSITLPPRDVRSVSPEGVLLETRELSKRYGGVNAVEDVSIKVRAGETLGLIGPNGAGKTTLFELIGGFARPDHGQVIFKGSDVSRLTAEARGRRGLIRSFQDAALFPTMDVLEVVTLALERSAPTRFVPSVLGLARADRQKQRRAREFVEMMGLAGYRDLQIRELSTGTRRIVELACLIALEPLVLLLDEPSSGIAQRETEALGTLLRRVKADLGLTLVIIEHDIPLVMSLSDRVIAMAAGRVIADAVPKEIQEDPLVVESYLGTDPRAILRSHEPAPLTSAPRGER